MDHCFLCNSEFVPAIGATHGFCGLCESGAKLSISSGSPKDKVKCYRCGDEYALSTMKKYGGFCNKCFKNSLIDTSDEDIKSPYRKERIPAALRAMVWKTYASPTYLNVKCWCCSTAEIDAFDFDCGHVVAESRGGETTLANLRPVCRLCNVSMGTMNMNEFMLTRGMKMSTEQCEESILVEIQKIIDERNQVDRGASCCILM